MSISFGSLDKSKVDLFLSKTPKSIIFMYEHVKRKPNDPTITRKSWSSLFSSSSDPSPTSKKSPVTFQDVRIRPRGLVNKGNMCFMNAVLQALVYCKQFFNCIVSLARDFKYDINSPLLESIIQFIKEFQSNEEDFGPPFVPEYVFDSLKSKNLTKGHQEDAEEFLGFLLDGLHSELISKIGSGTQDKEEWIQVGKRNKGIKTRQSQLQESIISQLFFGRFRSIVKNSAKESITIEHFHVLSLQVTSSVEQSIQQLTESEILESKTTKQLLFDHLPPILIIHLKRFEYDQGMTMKINLHVSYPDTLYFKNHLCGEHSYKLKAVVYHHGTHSMGGHYTCDVLWEQQWLRMDDENINPIETNKVFENGTGDAYILFYEEEK